MSFSDSDLKRLKEMKQKYNYFNFPTAWDVNEAYDLIEALLARLEDSEARLRECEAEVKKAHHSLTVTVLELEKLKPRLEAAESIGSFVLMQENQNVNLNGILPDLLKVWRKTAGR